MTTARKKTLILFDDGWRHEKLDLFAYMRDRVDFDLVTHDRDTYEKLKDTYTVHRIERVKTARRFPYYLLKLFAHELPTNMVRYKKEMRLRHRSLPARLFYNAHHWAGLLNPFSTRYSNAIDWQFRASNRHGSLLDGYDRFVFCPVHMRDKRIIYEAKNRGLKVVSWVYSWDNPLKDNEFMDNAARYFVWNEPCAEALCGLHPVPRDRVDIVGPVQFDYLRDIRREGRAVGHPVFPDESRRYVMYACANAYPAHVDQEVNVVLNIRRIMDEAAPDAELVVRPYPYRHTEDPYKKLRNIPGITLLEFGTSNENMVLMSRQDLLDRQGQIQRAACFINFASTMALEASYTDTPILQMAFNFPHDYPRHLDAAEVLKNEHLQLIIDASYPNTVTSEDGLRKALGDMLNGRAEPYMSYTEKLQRFANPLPECESYKQVFTDALERL